VTSFRLARRAAILGVLASLAFTNAAPAQSPEAFWRGKTVTVIAPTAPGGGYDAYTRLLARHMGKHIPGNPNLVVQNMPGAGGMVAANHVYNVAPRDGTVIAMIDRGIPTAPLLYGDESKAKFDPVKFTWLGSMAREAGVGAVATRAPAQTVDEMKKTEIFLGATGPETDNAAYARLFNDLLGTKFKVLSGYKNQPDIFLGIEKGELNGLFITGYSGSAKAWTEAQIAKGQMKLFVQMTTQKDPALGDVPGVLDLVTREEDRQVVELLLARLSLGRPVLAPPGIPADRVAALRKAFQLVVEAPELKAEADKQGLAIEPIFAEEAEDIIQRLYRLPPELIERTRKIIRVSGS
jgi:tripartite-type tricarboxylate transporter receptor subunit TctC